MTGDEAWQESINAKRERFSQNEEDWSVLVDFGRTLGNTDREHQVKAITQTTNRLELRQQEAKINADKNERIYRYMGVAAGSYSGLFIY